MTLLVPWSLEGSIVCLSVGCCMDSMSRTLVLSQGFEPLKIVTWRRAVSLLFLGKAEVLEEYAHDVKTVARAFKVPAVVRLLCSFRRSKRPVKFSRDHIYGRDKYTCQYCGLSKRLGELTQDHILPRSRGGLTSWMNIVTCCVSCNRRKGNRTPEEAGMNLRRIPVQPETIPILALVAGRMQTPPVWQNYLHGEARSEAPP